MGIIWGAAWGLFGLLVGVSSLLLPWLPWDAFFDFYDAPLPTFAMPGFISGAIFSIVLGVAARHRRFEDLSPRTFAAWGALGGVALSLAPALLADAGTPWLTAFKVTALIAVPLAALSALSASASLLIARRAERRERLMPEHARVP